MNATTATLSKPNFDIDAIRADFPILSREVYGKPLVYLDSAASAQKPRQVVDTIRDVYENDYSNVHRGIHYLSQRCTDRFEAARETVARFLKVKDSDSLIFTKGATEGLNLVAQSYARSVLSPGDEILISELEHHSNIVPWQIVAQEKGARIRAIPILDDGQLDMAAFRNLLNERTRIVAVTQVSNALGTVTPLAEIIPAAHAVGAKVVVDGCQATPHIALDLPAMDCDFFAFSGHKVYGPNGIGVLYGKPDLLEAMPPYQGGGEMIDHVGIESSTYKEPPHRFEAGTPPIVEAIALATAIDYVTAIGLDAIAAHEHDLVTYAMERLAEVPEVTLHGTAPGKASIVSFTWKGAHAHDVGTIIDRAGVAVRVGHHCAQPLMDRLGVPSTARASFGLYNTRDEVDRLVRSLDDVRTIFA
ncbi:MAG: cysteine desulfurase [Alphaproteobacteria bacterium]|nr:cysteine desulfurase [Alphaproteobacteria bacterium]MCB9930985.1 cysteine desulfurase [Alphaproteobacteria bacterium]